MVQIRYTDFESQSTDPGIINTARACLIFGENFLVRQTLDRFKTAVTATNPSGFSIDTLDGATASMGELIEQICTLSFFTPCKLIVVNQAPLFAAGPAKPGEIRYSASELDHLTAVIKSGIPENHFLVLTAAQADKRKKIFKTIHENGLVIDCSVSQGNRKADLDEQQAVLHSVARQILGKTGKTMDRQTFMLLSDLTGFNIDLLVQNLQKLAAYTGTKPSIDAADVKKLIHREKKDPIFNLTNAFMDKNATLSLQYLDSLLEEGYHELQILKSLENQIRKLLMARSAAGSNSSVSASAGNLNFNTFKQSVLPGIVQYDAQVQEWAQHFSDVAGDTSGKKNNSGELQVAPNPKNAYPVFQLVLKSSRFSFRELQDLLIFLSDIDLKVKSSAVDVRTVIEQMIINTCTKGGFVYAPEDKDRRHHF